mgnify:FL=1
MASEYTGTVRSITPSTTDDNWFLAGGAGEVAMVKKTWTGGEMTTTTAMCTRWARSVTGAGGGITAGNVAKHAPGNPTNVVDFGTTYATTQPTLDAGDLWAESWNAHGGIVIWEAKDPEDAWILVGLTVTTSVICCRNSVGTGTSTYGVTWQEF